MARSHQPSSPRKDRVALLEDEIQTEELSDTRGTACARRVLESLKIEEAVIEGESDDRPPRDLGFDAGAKEGRRAPRVDGPLVAVARNTRPRRQIRLDIASRDEIVSA